MNATKPVVAIVVCALILAIAASTLSSYLIGLPYKETDPNGVLFNKYNFSFEDYEGDPLYSEEVARLIFPQGMLESEVDKILLIDAFTSKSDKSDIPGLVYYIQSPAPWRMKRKAHSVRYDVDHKLVDVHPSNGRGIYSGQQLNELRTDSQENR